MAKRLNWGCGPDVHPGWSHSDIAPWPGMCDAHGDGWGDHIGAIQDGLPWHGATFDYVVSHHALQMLPETDLVPALDELRRVTKPTGWLRLGVPDFERAIRAWASGNLGWFPLDASDVDTALCVYTTQGGTTRSLFTVGRLIGLLRDAGWSTVKPAVAGLTWTPPHYRGITDLDNRPDETLYVEAQR